MLARLYRVLIRGLDEGTRRRHGDEMRAAFTAALAEARARGLGAWIWTAARMLGDAARCAARDRLAALGRRIRRRSSRFPSGLIPECDLTSATRWVRRSPVQSGAIVASVALSLGGATGLFSVADALLLRPLPVRDPGSLVALIAGTEHGMKTYFTYAVWRAVDQSGVLEVIACRRDALETGEPRHEPVSVLWVTGHFFERLGVSSRVGRLITPEDARTARPVAVLGHRYWRTRFSGDPDVVGRTLVVSGIPLTVVGVAPESFVGVDVDHRFDVAVPFETEPRIRMEESRLEYGSGVRILGRLAPGDSREAAVARLRAAQPRIRAAAVNPRWVPEYKAEYLSGPMALRPAAAGLSSLGERYRAVLWVLLATLALLVALAAANTASLLAARVVRRRVDLGVRATLGATPFRIALPIVLESLVLTATGAVLGYGVAALSGRLLLAGLGATPDAIERASPLEVRVVAFATGLLLLVAVASALVPSLQAARTDPVAAMRTGTPLARRGLAGRLLVASQVSLSLALLIVAGLAVQTFLELGRRPIGFDGRGLLVARIDSDELGGPEGTPRARELGRRALQVLSSSPELEAVGVSWITPLEQRARMQSWRCEAGDREPATDWVHFNAVSPDWFATYRTRVVAGRPFSDADVAGAPGVAIVNRAFAADYPCGGPVLGAVIHERSESERTPGPPLSVVGIVEDAVYRSYDETAPPTLYVPYAQMGDSDNTIVPPISVTVRPRGSHTAAVQELETALRGLSPAISVQVEPFVRRLDRALFEERLLANLSLAVALLGGLLAVLGSYAVAALDASARRRETAIRLALGASTLAIFAGVLRRAALALAVGLPLGTAVGFAFSRVAHSWLGTAAPVSAPVYAAAAGLLAMATLAAVTVAAARAPGVAPSRLLTAAD